MRLRLKVKIGIIHLVSTPIFPTTCTKCIIPYVNYVSLIFLVCLPITLDNLDPCFMVLIDKERI